jgi:hypothetical protein
MKSNICHGCGKERNEIKDTKYKFTQKEINFFTQNKKNNLFNQKEIKKEEGSRVICMKCFINCFNSLYLKNNLKIISFGKYIKI